MDGIRKIAQAVKVIQSEAKDNIRIQHINILIKLSLQYPEYCTYNELALYCKTTRQSIS